MTTLADLNLGAPLNDTGRREPVASQFDSMNPHEDMPVSPAVPAHASEMQAQQAPPPPPPMLAPVPTASAPLATPPKSPARAHISEPVPTVAPVPAPAPAAAVVEPSEPVVLPAPRAASPPPPPKMERAVTPVKTQTKEYETRLTPSVASAAPTDSAKHATADPIVPIPKDSNQNDVGDKDAARAVKAEQYVAGVELEKQRILKEKHGKTPVGTVVIGMEDDWLWASLRRFDKQVTHVLSPPHQLPKGEPDLRRSPLPTVPFDSNLIRTNMERLYSTAGVSGIRFAREMSRLMSWSTEERRRTGTFCLAYFIAWIFHQTTPLIIGLIIVLIVVPKSRRVLFPPIMPAPGVPISATDPTGTKGDESSISHADPRKHRTKAEQDEEQSWEFMKAVEGFGMRVLVGGKHKPSQLQHKLAREKHKKKEKFGQTTSEDEDAEDGVRDAVPVPLLLNDVGGPKSMANQAMVGTGKRDEVLKSGGTLDEAHEAEAADAKAKRDAMVGLYAKGLQDALGDFADAIERFGNALTPPAHYPKNQARAKLGGVLGVIALLMAVIPASVFAHAGSAALGIGFFAQPLLIRGAKKFVRLVPDWQEQLDLRNSLLHHVPTDAQLTLYLLRERERLQNPLPRPPPPATPVAAKKVLNDTSPLSGAADQAVAGSVGDGDEAHLVGDGDLEDPDGTGKTGSSLKTKIASVGKKIAGKGATFRGKGKVEVLPEGKDKKMKRTNREKLGAFLLRRGELKDEGSIWAYPAQFAGKKGHIILDTDDADDLDDEHNPSQGATVLFVPKGADEPTESFAVRDIAELKKGGVGLPRSVLGWAAGMELGGTSLEVRLKRVTTYKAGYDNTRYPGPLVDNVFFEDEGDEDEQGEVVQFERIGRRDGLFVRLLSVGPQEWETL